VMARYLSVMKLYSKCTGVEHFNQCILYFREGCKTPLQQDSPPKKRNGTLLFRVRELENVIIFWAKTKTNQMYPVVFTLRQVVGRFYGKLFDAKALDF